MSASSSASVTSATADRPAKATVAQDRHAVGEIADLGQAVGDVDDRGALRRDGRARREQQVDGLLAERRGRLVEDEQLRLHGERLRELEQVLLGDGEVADAILEVAT